MAINKDEIDKYIFDPENPKQCKSYGALLNIAKKENATYFSPEFLQYFFVTQIINKEFEESLWDKPTNYQSLTIGEKIALYEKNLSKEELAEFILSLKLNISKISQLSFLKQITYFDTMEYFHAKEHHSIIGREYKYLKLDYHENEDKFLHELIARQVPFSDSQFEGEEMVVDLEVEYDLNYIFLSKTIETFFWLNIKKSSILITLESSIENFFLDSNNGEIYIKPIFLKKIDDIDILLNVLEQDLQKEKQKEAVHENISTIDKINIENFFSIENIKLNNLKEKKEIYIVGENGDGKSLFLQSLAIALAGVKEGDVFDLVKGQSEYELSVLDSEEKEYTQNSEQAYNYLLAYGSSRNNSCQLKEDTTGYLTLFSAEYDLKSPTKWLQYLDYSEQKENDNIITVAEAKKLLQELLNSDITIDISPDKVTFTEKGSEVSFEQLSAGYRGVITIICDMIARLSEKQQVEHIKDFQGIVLIDEVELHLHPKWQYSFMNKLREIFPLIQFMVTTHSPTVLLGAGMEAVYYQIYKEKETGIVKILEQKDVKNDFLNDIQSNIFGFDVNNERINNPSEDDKKRQDRAKENLLDLINTIKEEK
jgi:predicted ATPase